MPVCVSTVYRKYMDKDHLDALLKKYLDGTCNDAERLLVEKWYAAYDKKEDISPGSKLSDQQFEKLYVGMVHRLKVEGEWPREKSYPYKIKTFIPWAAAVVVLLFSGSIYLWQSNAGRTELATVTPDTDTARFKNDIAPGTDKAILTLADGTRIVLDSLSPGTITMQGSTQITRLNEGQLIYQPLEKGSGTIYNTLTTPRGGQYALVLPDGSKAWLNASSSLRYPTAFTGTNRVVELTGEAYFEIASFIPEGARHKMPFIVKKENTEVQVLGTHFNVNAFDDERVTKVTLLEGSVKVVTGNGHPQSALLRPGQQATISPVVRSTDAIRVHPADIEEVMAWKNDLFWFENADIFTVMRQLHRWYDVEIVYEGKVEKKFNGTIPRNMSAISVLKILELTGGVHFKIDGKKILVRP